MALATLAWMLAALINVQWVQNVSAHGKLTKPASRNQIDGAAGCSHCLNGGGPCGDGASGKFLNYFAGSQETWTAGSIVPVTITVTAHHRGHYEMRICDEVLNSGVSNPDACLNKWVLERASPEEAGFLDCLPGDQRPACVPVDPNHPERWYLPPATEITGTHTMYWKVPANLQCEVCTLQWHWWSANSCIPAGDYGCYKDILRSSGYWVGSKAAWWTAGSGSCSGPSGPNGHFGCGEQFWNCADITVVSGTGPLPAPTPIPMPVPVPVPTPAPTPTPMPTPTIPIPAPSPVPTAAPLPSPTPTPAAAMSCEQCAGMFSSPCIWDDGKCYPMGQQTCVAKVGARWCKDSPAATTTTTTTVVTTTSMPSASCVLRFSGSAAFGATAARCKETCDAIPAGMWPCSSDGPCDCSSSAMLVGISQRTQLRGRPSEPLMAGVGFIQENARTSKVEMHLSSTEGFVATETCSP